MEAPIGQRERERERGGGRGEMGQGRLSLILQSLKVIFNRLPIKFKFYAEQERTYLSV